MVRILILRLECSAYYWAEQEANAFGKERREYCEARYLESRARIDSLEKQI